MRIGIDIDDTISNTNDSLIECAIKYDREHLNNKGIKYRKAYDLSDMFYWTIEEKEQFFIDELENVIKSVIIKAHASEVINRLKDEGNEIYIITYRTDRYISDPYEISAKWLKDNNVKYDKLIVNSGPKGIVCYNNNIDLFIDDTPVHCEDTENYGIKSLLFNSEFNQDEDRFRRVTNWEEVYNIIKEVK